MRSAVKEKATETELPACNARRMNECLNRVRHIRPPVHLFDEYWRESELAMLFGPAGSGKSVLATQIAEALARGSGIDGFRVATGGRRVLYVDLQQSEAQIETRYTYAPDALCERRIYKFSERLFRAEPDMCGDVFIKWLRATLTKQRFDIVIIDDLSSLKTTNAGTCEALQIMRGLKRIRNEMAVSILVVAGSNESRLRKISDADLGHSRVICTVADSVFAIGKYRDDERMIVQVRSRHSPILWNEQNAPLAVLKREGNGMLCFKFDDRFMPYLSEEELDLIRRIKALRDQKKSFRAVAEELSIPKSRAERLSKKWTPSMVEESVSSNEKTGVGYELPASGKEMPPDGEQANGVFADDEDDDETPDPNEWDGAFSEDGPAHDIVEIDDPVPKTIYDLETRLNGYGRTMYVAEEWPDGRPSVWYTVTDDGVIHHHKRHPYYIRAAVVPTAALPTDP